MLIINLFPSGTKGKKKTNNQQLTVIQSGLN